MTIHTFDLSGRANGINLLELITSIKAADSLAEASLIRSTAGVAQSLSIQTTSAVSRATFQGVIDSHVPTKTEAASAAALNEETFKAAVVTKLAEPEFKSFVESEISKLGGK